MPQKTTRDSRNLLGSYGPWAANAIPDVGDLSLRSGSFRDIDQWRNRARARMADLLLAPAIPRTPAVRVEKKGLFDGLYFERLSWQLPYGPRTSAVLLRPADPPRGRKLPAVLALHDHSGRRYFGWRKNCRITAEIHPLMQDHVDAAYSGKFWANELARRGYVVLSHDTLMFGSRRILRNDVPDRVAAGRDPGADENLYEVIGYNTWAGGYESVMSKSLLCSGTTMPGCVLADDQAALSILAERPEVDPTRLGCGGLSGGGCRTVFLAGMDQRIKASVSVGFFTTWRDMTLNKSWTHTWMGFVPGAPRHLDFPEIYCLRAPAPAMIQMNESDPLYTFSEVRRAGRMARDVYRKAGQPKALVFKTYPGGHQFDTTMQADAFAFFDRNL